MSMTPRHSDLFRQAMAGAMLAIAAAMPMKARSEVTSPVLMINDDAAKAEVSVQQLRGNVSVLMGSGGNITVLASPEGKLLVDAGIAVSKARVSAALDSLGPGPLKYVIDTHYHWDHTDGNAWVHEAGATVVAHENTLKRLTSGTRVIEWGFFFPPAPPAALPTIVVQNEKTIGFGGEDVMIRHYQNSGHTDTDLAVYFPRENVLAVGDIWWNAHYPFIDNGAGGSIDGVIAWVTACIKSANEDTIIVPGHGAVSNRAEFVEFREMLVEIRANVARLKKQGKTLAETIAAKPTAKFDAKFGDFLINPAFFTQLVYMGV